MSDLAHPTSGYEAVESEPPELLGRNLISGAHLLASATAFFFLAFLFAYFYLRSLNSAGLWHPKHVSPSLALGTILTAAVAASSALVALGVRDLRAGRRFAWRLKGALALGLGLLAVALQALEWSTQGFGPADGGYASVYCGWTSLYLVFVVGTLFWLETLLATAIRYRNVGREGPTPGEASGDPGRLADDIANPISLMLPGLESLSFYWAFVTGIGVLAWILLYLI